MSGVVAAWPRLLAVVVAGAVGALIQAPGASADTALWVQGAAARKIPLSDIANRIPLGYTLQGIDYPAGLFPWTGPATATGAQSIAAGVPALDQAIRAAQGQGRTLVMGESLGSMVVEQELRDLAGRADAPDPAMLRFQVIGDPSRPGGLFSYLPVGAYEAVTGTVTQPIAETPYDVTVVKLQYDGIASFPDRPWNLLAVANALAGAVFYHGSDRYGIAVQSLVNGQVPPGTVTSVVNSSGGVTTTYTVRQDPALLYPLQPVMPKLVAAVNTVLTPMIDQGYSELTPDAGPHLAPGGLLVDAPTRAVGGAAAAAGAESKHDAIRRPEGRGPSPGESPSGISRAQHGSAGPAARGSAGRL